MSTTKDFGLKEDPFVLWPRDKVEDWAGMPKTKMALEDVVRSVRPDDIGSSEFAVILGEYGAGKSHAMRYFTNQINKDNKSNDSLAIYMSQTVTRPIGFSNLYLRIIEHLEDEPMHRICDSIEKSVGDCKEKISKEKDFSLDTDQTIKAVVSNKRDRNMIKHIYEQSRIPEPNRDNHEAASQLASLIHVMTMPIGDNEPPFKSVYLFLDEVEEILEEKHASQVQLFSALRTLINDINENFALVLSFTLQMAVLEAAVPDALKERLTRSPIECEKLDSEQAKEFVRELIEQRRDGNQTHPPFYPFSEDAIDIIFERETTLNPRRILSAMQRIFKRAVHHEGLQPGEDISREMAEEILKSVGL